MTTTVYVESDQATRETMYLVQSAISKEVATLKLAIRAGERRLAEFEKKYGVSSDYFIAELAAEDMDERLRPFEEKYGVSSDFFIKNYAAEDLDEGDDEYIRWDEKRVVDLMLTIFSEKTKPTDGT